MRAVYTPAEAAAVREFVTAELKKAPPLSEQQRDRLGLLMRRTKREKRAA